MQVFKSEKKKVSWVLGQVLSDGCIELNSTAYEIKSIQAIFFLYIFYVHINIRMCVNSTYSIIPIFTITILNKMLCLSDESINVSEGTTSTKADRHLNGTAKLDF